MSQRAELTAIEPIRRIGSTLVRAVLIVNPNATSTTAAGRDLLAHALESRAKLTVAHTDHRGHAIEIAAKRVARFAPGLELKLAVESTDFDVPGS